MTRQADAIFFDMGGTLRIRVKDSEMRNQALIELARVLEFASDPEDLAVLLNERAQAYKRWSEETLREAPESEIWTKWMLPDHSPEKVRGMAIQLEHLWRATQGRRVVRPDAKKVVSELERRGYRLGIISNTTSSDAVPRGLVEYSLARYFSAVVLSSTFGHRKPGLRIFHEATQRLGVDPEKCAYVGDRPSRDILGSKQAGFALAILINDDGAEVPEPLEPYPDPDYIIHSLTELLDIF